MGPLEEENGGGGDPSPGMGGVVAISLALAQASPLLAVTAAGRPPLEPQGAPWPCAAHGAPPRFVGHESYVRTMACAGGGQALPCSGRQGRGVGALPGLVFPAPPRCRARPPRPCAAPGGGGRRGRAGPAVACPRRAAQSPLHVADPRAPGCVGGGRG